MFNYINFACWVFDTTYKYYTKYRTTVKTSTQLIQDAIGITEEQAKAIEDILSQCEVTDISEVTYKPKLDEDYENSESSEFVHTVINTLEMARGKLVVKI